MKLLLVIAVILVIHNTFLFGQDEIVFSSDNIPHNDTNWVFKPSNYKASDSYPLVIMLHGWSGNHKQWNNIINLQDYANTFGFIIVCPDGFYDSWYINSPILQNSKYEDYFFSSLLKGIKKRYSVNEKQIFITGLSMGGHGALYLFFKNPLVFKSAGSTSGSLDLCIPQIKSLGLKKIINPQDCSKYSVINIASSSNLSGKKIIFDCGTDDILYNINKNFKKKCDKMNISNLFIENKGDHNRDYWSESIKYHFIFFAKQCKGN